MASTRFWLRRLNPEKRAAANVKIAARARVKVAHRQQVAEKRRHRLTAKKAAAAEQTGGTLQSSQPFYARRLPSDTPRLFGTRNNPVWFDRATSSMMGRYNNAVHNLRNGDVTAIDDFIGQTVTDANGNTYELLTDEAEINAMIGTGREIDYYKNYRTRIA